MIDTSVKHTNGALALQIPRISAHASAVPHKVGKRSTKDGLPTSRHQSEMPPMTSFACSPDRIRYTIHSANTKMPTPQRRTLEPPSSPPPRKRLSIRSA